MTVATEAAYAEMVWTGAQTSFSPGFSAENLTDVLVSYLDVNGLPVELTFNVHYGVSLGADDAVTVTPITFPTASPAAPVTIIIGRNTLAVQGVDFINLSRYDPSVYETLFDRAYRILGELKGRMTRAVAPFFVTDATVDFRPLRVSAADPVNNYDVATKAYADLVSGTDAAGQAATSAAAALVSQLAAAASQVASAGSAALAATYAAILGNPDDGLYSDTVGSSIDDGTYP